MGSPPDGNVEPWRRLCSRLPAGQVRAVRGPNLIPGDFNGTGGQHQAKRFDGAPAYMAPVRLFGTDLEQVQNGHKPKGVGHQTKFIRVTAQNVMKEFSQLLGGALFAH